jgi:hypothetical protein
MESDGDSDANASTAVKMRTRPSAWYVRAVVGAVWVIEHLIGFYFLVGFCDRSALKPDLSVITFATVNAFVPLRRNDRVFGRS